MRRLFLATVFVVVLLIVGLQGRGLRAESDYFPGLTLDYGAIARPISEKSELPLRLPSYLPGYAAEVEEYGPSIDYQVYFPYLEEVSPTFYSVSLSTIKECSGATACEIYSIRAELITARVLPFSEKLEQMRENPGFSDLQFRSLELGSEGTVPGIFIPSRCFAYCTQSTVVFDLAGVRYTVGVKAGDPAEVVAIATSMIEQPITLEDFNDD
jgi:hypothetical protein